MKYLLSLSLLSLCCGIISCSPVPTPTKEQKIGGIPGPEDVIIDHTRQHKTLLISSTDRRNKAALGKILRYDPKTKKLTCLKRVGDSNHVKTFNPHGIDLVRGQDDINRLYVVSHPTKKSNQILIYQLRGNSLIFESCPSSTVGCDIIHSANDLVATPEGHIYVTNVFDKSIAHFNPKAEATERWSKIHTGLSFSNGIFRYKQNIYCSGSSGRIIKIPPRKITNTASHPLFVRFQGVMDNINAAPDFSENAEVIVTSHSKPLRFFLHSKSALFDSPSRVFKFSLNNSNQKYELKTSDDGPLPISGSSAAVIIDGDLYVGQAIGNYILHLKKGEWKYSNLR